MPLLPALRSIVPALQSLHGRFLSIPAALPRSMGSPCSRVDIPHIRGFRSVHPKASSRSRQRAFSFSCNNLYNNIRRTAQPSCQTMRRFVSVCQKRLWSNASFCDIIGAGTHTQIFPSLQPLCLRQQVRRFLFYCCTWDPSSSAAAASANVCMALL